MYRCEIIAAGRDAFERQLADPRPGIPGVDGASTPESRRPRRGVSLRHAQEISAHHDRFEPGALAYAPPIAGSIGASPELPSPSPFSQRVQLETLDMLPASAGVLRGFIAHAIGRDAVREIVGCAMGATEASARSEVTSLVEARLNGNERLYGEVVLTPQGTGPVRGSPLVGPAAAWPRHPRWLHRGVRHQSPVAGFGELIGPETAGAGTVAAGGLAKAAGLMGYSLGAAATLLDCYAHQWDGQCFVGIGSLAIGSLFVAVGRGTKRSRRSYSMPSLPWWAWSQPEGSRSNETCRGCLFCHSSESARLGPHLRPIGWLAAGGPRPDHWSDAKVVRSVGILVASFPCGALARDRAGGFRVSTPRTSGRRTTIGSRHRCKDLDLQPRRGVGQC